MIEHTSYSKYPEWLIWLLIKQGDQQALAEVFDRLAKPIFRFIYFKVSSSEVAEDLASQVFLKFIEQLKNNPALKVSSLKAYLYRIAKNLVIDYYRTREKEELPLIYSDDQIPDSLVFDPTIEYEINELEKIINSLKAEYKEVMILRHIEGMSINEIAKILDKTSGNIRIILHRALKQLQDKHK